MDKHTPGPWSPYEPYEGCGRLGITGPEDATIVADGFDDDDNSYGVAADRTNYRHPTPDQMATMWANANLIAAAPTLLNAVKVLLASAVPHPTEHPTMTAAWIIGRAALEEAQPPCPNS